MKPLIYTKSLILVIYWGLRSLRLYYIIGLTLIPFSGMVFVSVFYPENPVKWLCVVFSVFCLWFGNYIILKK
jgi:hypothetical protein